MGSMNWLGFSLSPQEVVQADASISEGDHHHHDGQDHHDDLSDQTTTLVSRLGFKYSDEISHVSGGDCFDLTSHDNSSATTTGNHLPPSFGMLHAAFNSNNNIHSQGSAGWIMNSSDNSHYKTTSDHLSMLMGTSCNSQNLENHHQQPKLENFLGRHSFVADHGQMTSAHAYNNNTSSTSTNTDYIFSRNACSLQLPLESHNATNIINGGASTAGNNNINNSNSSGIGLSMIKTWLRNQPVPPHHQQENKNDINGINATVTNTSTCATSTSSAHTLSLSMSTGSHTHTTAGGSAGETCSSDLDDNNNNNKQANIRTTATTFPAGIENQTSSGTAIEAVPRKSIDTFGQRTSIYRGVTRHRWTGRYEAHLWDNSCRREGQTRKGRQVYLGGYDKEEKAAKAYDLAALKYWGTTTTTNFPISNYEKEIDEMKHMTRQEYVASLRRKSSGFSRGASIYRGVTRHHQHGRWQARIGRVAGNKDLYLGTFSTQEEAAEAYDIAAIKFRGLNAVTNFDMSRYDVKSILESSTLPIGGAAKRLKDVEQAHHHHEMTLLVDGHNRSSTTDHHHDKMMSGSTGASHDQYHQQLMSSSTNDSYGLQQYQHAAGFPTLAFNQATAHQAPFGMHYYSSVLPYNGQTRVWCKQEQDTNSNTTQNFYQHHHDQQQQDQELRHHQLLQLGSTHNFFQPAAALNVNLMGSSTDSMEHSSGSNSVIYSSTTGTNGGGGDQGGYIIPTGTVVANDHIGFMDGSSDHHDQAMKAALGYEYVFGASSSTTTDAYNSMKHARSLYYLQPTQSSSVSSVGVLKGSTYDRHQAPACNNNWVPTAVPTSTNNNMAPTFTVWNDT